MKEITNKETIKIGCAITTGNRIDISVNAGLTPAKSYLNTPTPRRKQTRFPVRHIGSGHYCTALIIFLIDCLLTSQTSKDYNEANQDKPGTIINGTGH